MVEFKLLLGKSSQDLFRKGSSMMTTHDEITGQSKLIDVTKMGGVKDLRGKVKGLFAQALIAEAKGDNEAAEIKLEKAIAAETELAIKAK